MKFFKWFGFIPAFLFAACSAKADSDVEVVTPVEFRAMLADDADAFLLDARSEGEYASGHLVGAHLLDWFDASGFKAGVAAIDRSKTIYIYCRSGRRSNEAAHYLSKEGYRVIDMKGGILAWEREGLPVTAD